MTYNRKTSSSLFLLFGFVFLLFSLLLSAASLSTGRFPVGPDVILFGVAVMAFCNAYLVPHFEAKDERSRTIRERGMYYSYFLLLGLLLVLMTLFQFTPFDLNGFQTTSVIVALIMITVFSSFVVVSKRI